MQTVIDYALAILRGSNAVRAIVGNKIYFESTPEGIGAPFVTVDLVSDIARNPDLTSVGDIWLAELQINAFTKSKDASQNIASIILSLFNSTTPDDVFLSCEASQVAPLYEPNDQLYQFVLTIKINHII